jgi:hypothetical protein
MTLKAYFDLIQRTGAHSNPREMFTIYLRGIAPEILPFIGEVLTLQVESTFSQSWSSGLYLEKSKRGERNI